MQEWESSESDDGNTNASLRGHTFHYATARTPLTPIAHTRPAPGSARPAGEAIYRHGNTHASYFHPWFASSPQATARLFGA